MSAWASDASSAVDSLWGCHQETLEDKAMAGLRLDALCSLRTPRTGLGGS